jgi:hypothetical protein
MTGFDDCQRLETLRDKLSLAQEILESTSQVAEMIQTLRPELQPEMEPDIRNGACPFNFIAGYIKRVEGFKQTAAALEKQTKGASKIVSSDQVYATISVFTPF